MGKRRGGARQEDLTEDYLSHPYITLTQPSVRAPLFNCASAGEAHGRVTRLRTATEAPLAPTLEHTYKYTSHWMLGRLKAQGGGHPPKWSPPATGQQQRARDPWQGQHRCWAPRRAPDAGEQELGHHEGY